MGHDAAGSGWTYAVPAHLSPLYGSSPFSFQLFLHVRPPTMHRMIDVIMTQGAGG
jgi:hypothetical protein